MVHLLEVLPDLGADLMGEHLDEARRLVTAPLIELESGAWDPTVIDPGSVRGRLLGYFVVDGMIVRETALGDRVCTSLFGPDDLIACDELIGSVPIGWHHSVPGAARVAPIDDRFLAACRRWPRLAGRLFGAAARQANRAATHQAISQLPRVEDRIAAVLWHLADRFGRVHRGGVSIDLPLTHETLGRLIGARRPTVTLGLQQLEKEGAVTRTPEGGWWLDPAWLGRLSPAAGDTGRFRQVLSGRAPARHLVATG